MAQTPSYTNLYVNHNRKMIEEQFPTSPGGRYHTFITNKGGDADIVEFSKGILTLLKDTLYSLSIKLEAIDNYTVKNLKYKFNGEIYVFDIKKNCYEINESYNDYIVTHILIIGNFQNNSDDTSQKDFVISKTYLIINVEIKGTAKYTEGVSSEEYLNLYYIEHFSLDIKEFMEIYSKYKEQVTDIDDTERTGLSDAETKAKGVLEETFENTLEKFNDDESNDKSEDIRSRERSRDSPGAGEPATDGQDPGDPATVGQVPGDSATVVPVTGDKVNDDSRQDGGKKLASKVKKNKNKKNKVV